MRIIAPQTIAFTAKVSEDEIRERMAYEVLEQIGALGENGKPLPGVRWSVTRGTGRSGCYVIEITGPAPVHMALPPPEDRRHRWLTPTPEAPSERARR